MDLDLPLLAATLTGLAVFALAVALAPGVAHQRVLAVRLARFLTPPPGLPWTARASAAARAWPARPAWLRLPLLRFARSWASGREAVLLAVALAAAAAAWLTRDVVLTLAAVVQVMVFANLLGADVLAARRRQVETQTLPTLLRLSAGLRAGSSLIQAIADVAADAPSPTRQELARALDEIAVGTPIDEALDRMSQRLGTADYQALVLMLTVHRRVGGNVARLLDDLGEVVRERMELRDELATLTAQQRLSTWVLVLLPYIMAGVFGLADPAFLEPLFTTQPGRLLVLVSTLMLAVGSWALRWAGRVEP